MNYIILFFRFIYQHIGKILSAVILCVIFIFVLFPFSDLNDFISSKISELTQKKVFVQFEDMHINPLSPSVSLDQVHLEAGNIDNLSIDSIMAKPSLMALIKRQAGGHLTADGLFKGQLDLKLTPISTLESGAQKLTIDLEAQKMNLQDVRKTLKLSLPLTGIAQLTSHLNVDSSFQEQPDGEFQATIDSFDLVSASLNLGMDVLNLPDIKMKKIDIKGKLNNGKITIDSGKLGLPTDDLFGQVTGEIGLKISMAGGKPTPEIGNISVNIDLTAKQAFKDKASLFLTLLSQCVRDNGGVTQIKCKVVANANGVPQFLPLN